MKSILFIGLFVYSVGAFAQTVAPTDVAAAAQPELPILPNQRAAGTASEGLSWKAFFNFPLCDHSVDLDKKKGAWCLPTDSGPSARSNGVEAELVSWITSPETKSLYLSYFSFSNKVVTSALCKETSKRPDLKVTIFMDAGEAQVGALESNIMTMDQEFSDSTNKKYDPNYKTGCLERINPRATARGSGGFGGGNDYIQHSKIFLALDQPSLPESVEEMQQWLSKSAKVRFTSGSANMSSFGTSLHFDNWIFFEAPATNFVAQQNICTMMAFRSATGAPDVQRQEFKDFYQACEQSLAPNYMRDLRFYIVPSTANNMGYGPTDALSQMIYNANDNVKVSIHRFTTSAVANPLGNVSRQGISVKMIQDDDTLRASVLDGGPLLDVGPEDTKMLCRNLKAGIDVTFVETSAEDAKHMFHSKYVIVDDATLFQGAGNFTASALNAWSQDGNYEQFYVIRIPELAEAYSKAWTYLRSISTKMRDHEVGNQALQCTDESGMVSPVLELNQDVEESE